MQYVRNKQYECFFFQIQTNKVDLINKFLFQAGKRNEKFKPALVDDSVLARIPDADLGRSAPQNVMAVVPSVDDGFYGLLTNTGDFKNFFVKVSFNWYRQKCFHRQQ